MEGSGVVPAEGSVESERRGFVAQVEGSTMTTIRFVPNQYGSSQIVLGFVKTSRFVRSLRVRVRLQIVRTSSRFGRGSVAPDEDPLYFHVEDVEGYAWAKESLKSVKY
ncbi:hypothetical protein E3N88_30935 [Mikania micrantha]|uniref:Uncharacterized protein n=1 Tax=Mikania micrantha TaxID=192012 RepID=A0A5N6MMZ7_9ASTR|nr:hypothetical protein E3N88_30935 [Mikania micrantha]